jgi:mercuric ion transport protein
MDMKSKLKINEVKASILGSTLASLGAILASSCCISPIVFFNLGLGGAWLANLAVLQPYRIHFIVMAGLLFAIGLFFYIRRFRCATATCPPDIKKNRWVVVTLIMSGVLIAAAVIWPVVEPHLVRAIR